jgi:tetratricopeptide (TPR) repeat protein
MERLIALVLAAALVTAPAAASADQDDARLDHLFAKLHTATSQEEADRIAGSIWEIWTDSDDDEIDRLMAIGIAAMDRHNYGMALTAFNIVVEKAPGFAEGWNKRATVFYLIGNYPKSIADVDRTLALEPRHFGAISGLGLIHLAQGDEPAALAAFERALQVNPHMPFVTLRVRELKRKLKGEPT